jgi:hypothetical protein
MNFLAHFILARNRKSPEYHLGALLPDLARRAGIPISKGDFVEINSGGHKDILEGMQLHWLADRHFHNSSLFQEGCNLWKSEIGRDVEGLNRKFFLYHLLFEMWLDRLLLEKHPEAGDEMYESLYQVHEPGFRQFSLDHASDPEFRILSTLQDFQERKFILHYSAEERFAGIATGVFAHITRQAPDPGLKEYLLNKLPSLDRHGDVFLAAWEEFKEKLLSENTPESA